MKVVIIDTGCANLSSVRYAIERLGYQVQVSKDPEVVLGADKLFLPGVGTAREAMKNLRERGLVELINRLHQPVLGICLGMQMLVNRSEEGDVECLGKIDADCTKLVGGDGIRLPHMGWNQITPLPGHPLFKDIPDGSFFYFVHSYAVPVGEYTLASCQYGQAFSAAIGQENFFGVQFHPERSGAAGAQLLKNFLEL
ncbi:imidazole glycerol phosphate synthase subunit HisH [Zobellella denitrificans]|uniref:Imidazole glycerol phosphate synthase subunit HisH n=1 Tax=Zobellella denitrificans TaxID=347534 RepID=A0A231N2S9_9GAMM|nr:imidazole glycerol phosphate synthase subunit HisH [Zobellella denitrificans]ATG74066.1 imidazole glycerol phosphate synthase [Zobellella denitrificans]OXS16807.1 imidazole glycerol phosphate synthase subunit HisH [Zobellella denitrificans]